ncbi:hypothetical protein [Pseudonocardia thermophila]|jgi:hypothetical protein|uniref:hypothetical protein n=1 Tax=Pseudonocardia thermophila TaxID=1848 RepID=UPI00248D5EF2|nr:hypothetical protein [Pseudonocardia thermophila]
MSTTTATPHPATYAARPADRGLDEPTAIVREYTYPDQYRYPAPNRFEIDNVARDVPEPGDLDPVKLWTGGIATAVVAALIGLVGALVVQAVTTSALHLPAAAIGEHTTILLCTLAALGALAATGLAHLLVVSTPRPLAYLGWIVGLATTAATVLPFLTIPALPLAAATAVIHLVIGLAIGSLVAGAVAGSRR